MLTIIGFFMFQICVTLPFIESHFLGCLSVMCDDGTALVVDNGSGVCKAGFAYVGDKAQNQRSILTLKHQLNMELSRTG